MYANELKVLLLELKEKKVIGPNTSLCDNLTKRIETIEISYDDFYNPIIIFTTDFKIGRPAIVVEDVIKYLDGLKDDADLIVFVKQTPTGTFPDGLVPVNLNTIDKVSNFGVPLLKPIRS